MMRIATRSQRHRRRKYALQDEILYTVFSYLGDANDAKTARVCKLWSALRRVFVLPRAARVWNVLYSPDGGLLAADGGRDCCPYHATVALYDASSGERQRFFSRDREIKALAFGPCGSTLLAVGGDDAKVAVYDYSTGRLVYEIERAACVWALAFSPSGQRLAVGGGDAMVGLYDARTGEMERQAMCDAEVNTLSWSADGRHLAIGGDENEVSLVDVQATLKMPPDPDADGPWVFAALDCGGWVFTTCFAPDSKTLAAGSRNCRLALFDVASGKRLHTLTRGSSVESSAFSKEGDLLAVGSYDGSVGVYAPLVRSKVERHPGELIRYILVYELVRGPPVRSVSFAPCTGNGETRTLAIGGWDRRVTVFDVSRVAAPQGTPSVTCVLRRKM